MGRTSREVRGVEEGRARVPVRVDARRRMEELRKCMVLVGFGGRGFGFGESDFETRGLICRICRVLRTRASVLKKN